MNEERDYTELAELLKQLPAPTRLDEVRRHAVFAALPDGRAPRRILFVLAKVVQYAAVIVLVLGVIAGLVIPSFVTKRAVYVEKKPADIVAMSGQMAVKGNVAYCVPPWHEEPALEGCFDYETEPPDGMLMYSPIDDEPAPSPSAAPAPADAPMLTPSPRPERLESVATLKSPIVMRGIVGASSPGHRGRAPERVPREASLPSPGDAGVSAPPPPTPEEESRSSIVMPGIVGARSSGHHREALKGADDSAAGSFGESLGGGMAAEADGKAVADDSESFLSALGAEWPKGPDGSPAALGGELRESKAESQDDETRQRRQSAVDQAALGLARLDGLKSDLLDEPRRRLESTETGPFTLVPTAERPLSTFGLDVDSAGYSRAVALIDAGSRPVASTIRQEEFVNAFDYGDLAPAEATFRVYLEGAASPFRPGRHLLRVGVKGRRLGREEQRPLRLTILLDASGSMDTPERMALAKRAIEALLAKLAPADAVTLLTCSDKTRKVFSLSGWDRPEIVKQACDELAAIRCQGATNLEDGIVRAFESAAADFGPKAENRVVILSDGIANLGSANAEEILGKVAAYRDRGISCSVVGVGRSTYNDALLEAMANRGNGQYRFLDSEAAIHESFVEDLQASFNTIASDVKIQVEWNGAAVKAYRSHGYDSRALRDEQFRDDSVDAGEVGSGQGVTVVYEMLLEEGLKPSASLGTVRIRYRRIDTGAVEEIEAPIAAEAVQGDFARTRPQFRLACAVAEFATTLKHVPPAGQANALRRVAVEAGRVAAELDHDAPARGFAETVGKLMGLGL
ncbi:MAG: YfbK domain-containing protein [Kiritimatiellia bacterium]|jgi:Ca-activated chloride channel family protein